MSKATIDTTNHKEFNVNPLVWVLTIGWTVTLVLVLIWNWLQIAESTEQEALIALRMTVQKDMTFRIWATGHGGVYVPITFTTPPNPYLLHIQNRDITNVNGDRLTLLNPAYIMRQVSQTASDRFGIYSRLTSLHSINPVNDADPWEAETLKKFHGNKDLTEISEITYFHGQPSVRLMQPFYMEQGCLKCHGYQGYQVGDLHGGITAAASLEPYMALARSKQIALLPGYGLIWLIGVVSIWWFLRQLQLAGQNLKEKEIRNRAIVEAIPDMLFRYSGEGVYLDAEIKKTSPVFHGQIIGQKVTAILPASIAATLLQAIEKTLSSGQTQLIEYSYRHPQGTIFFEERLVPGDKNEVISIVRDVTDQKNFVTRLEYLSFHDQLTGIHNRIFFENEFKRLSTSNEYPISIISADVNGLKIINDTLGHAAGDQLLTACARVLKQSLRSTDILARVGGDEFAAILPRTSKKDGRKVINRIQSNISGYNEEFASLPLSLAVGIATAENGTTELVDTYKKADDLMYKEKMAQRATVKDAVIKALASSLKDQACPDEAYRERLEMVCGKVGQKPSDGS